MPQRWDRLEQIAIELAEMLTQLDKVSESEKPAFTERSKRLTDDLNQLIRERDGAEYSRDTSRDGH
jgi:hypothetical protein